MRLRARALACLWIVRGQGPAVFRARPPREALESSLPASPSRRFVVAGALVADGLRLDVWQAGESAAPVNLDVKVPLADVAGLIAQAEEALVSALVARGILPATPPPFRRSPPAGVLGGYVSALEQLFYQVLGANGIVKAESLWNERGFFETYVGLVEAWTDPPDSARLIGICGVLAARAYGSAVAEPYRKIVLRWVEDAPPASVLRKLAPAVFRRLGEPGKREAWLRASAPSTDAAYSAWLERVKAAT
jgi:hypothetical protein